MSEFLNTDELRAYTGKARREDQARVLDADGVPFKRRGRDLVVLWAHVRQSMEGRPVRQSREPDASAIL